MNKKNFDLTTVKGMQIAKGFISNFLFKTPIGLTFLLCKKIIGSDRIKEQEGIIKRLILKGKEKGLDEIEIVIKNIKDLDFAKKFDGAYINLEVGNEDKTILKVKYKK